jgi:hypothetical protein
MADETADTENATGKRNYTAPKGRPTRPRSAVDDQRRVFGPVAQWLTFALVLLIAVIVLIIITDGGDFNPFDDDGSTGAPAVADVLPLS